MLEDNENHYTFKNVISFFANTILIKTAEG